MCDVVARHWLYHTAASRLAHSTTQWAGEWCCGVVTMFIESSLRCCCATLVVPHSCVEACALDYAVGGEWCCGVVTMFIDSYVVLITSESVKESIVLLQNSPPIARVATGAFRAPMNVGNACMCDWWTTLISLQFPVFSPLARMTSLHLKKINGNI